MDVSPILFPSASRNRPTRSEREHANVRILTGHSYENWGVKRGIGRGVGSVGGNGGEITGCGHGGRGLKCWSVHHGEHVAFFYHERHELLTFCQNRWGVIGQRLMSA